MAQKSNLSPFPLFFRLDCLRSPDAAIRLQVALALGMGGNPAAVPMLAGLKEDPDMNVRAAVNRALAVLGPAEL